MTHSGITKVKILGRESIHVGYNLVQHIIHTCLSELPSSAYVLITDTNIAPLYLDDFSTQVNQALARHDLYPNLPKDTRFLHKEIPPGETSKSRETKANLEDWLLSHRCNRDTVILALGGGVIGDMIGFVAATYMRGVRFVQIPTTLLAMVDSAIGGKTAVDTPLGKNLIGSFHQPEFIFEDLSFLNTLPNREFINGMAEVIKTAAIWNLEKFVLLEQSASRILDILAEPLSRTRFDNIRDLLQDVVISSILVKAEVVSADEKEGGLRNLLNFGHSIGHAYEAILTPEILHGEAVSVGMVKEAELSRLLGHLSPNAVGRLIKCLQAWGLPTDIEDDFITAKTAGRATPTRMLLDIMSVDKKNAGRIKRVVLLKEIGLCYELKASDVFDEHIEMVLSPHIAIHGHLGGQSRRNSQKSLTCRPPGSKSISNRAMVLAALSGGQTKLINLLASDDTRYMQNALELLGAAKFHWNSDGSLTVHGTGILHQPIAQQQLFLGNAGTAARFLTSITTLIGGEKPVVVTGNDRMKARPIGPLVDALQSNGSRIEYQGTSGCLPLLVFPGFKGGRVELSAAVSSQYVSSLLMAAPFAEQEMHLVLTGDKVISELYIDMTISMMKSFGIEVEKLSTAEYIVPKGHYTAPEQYEIESDASSATYPLSLAALLGMEVIIPNIGYDSLQGDAKFAKEVLEPMGCVVTQTTKSTTVRGPADGRLRAIEKIDMESMTDAFLTASVLAACTKSPMSITGIANQRVKECNRIAAMITELAKFGVTASELPDGIQINGIGIESLKTPASSFISDGIETYDDHRIAMSFSLLASVTGGQTLIRDKKCTSKTWPGWWDILSREFEIRSSGSDELPETPRISVDSTQSIIVVGMRGAGKTTMGALAATILKRPFIDLDDMLEHDYGKKISNITEEDGWPAFREKELATLKKFVKTKPHGWIAACGGGIVETPDAVGILQAYVKNGGIVLQIHRDITSIVDFLGEDTTRPAWNRMTGNSREEIFTVWKRRQPILSKVSNFQYYSADFDGQSTHRVNAFTRFLQQILFNNKISNLIVQKKRSYFLSLTYTNICLALEHLASVSAGCDALELRVDLLQENSEEAFPSIRFVSEQLAILRENSDLPIIFTIRTQSQGGKFPDNREDVALELMCLAGKWAVEYIDVEMSCSEATFRQVRRSSPCSKIIASHHDIDGKLTFSSASWTEYYDRGCRLGDVVKLIGCASSIQDNFALLAFHSKLALTKGPPLIILNMGSQGTLSRVLGRYFTPITHSLMPNKAAPGQLSLREINTGLTLLGQHVPKQFYIFGSPISHSRSPALHNFGFSAIGLPHTYARSEATTVTAYESILQSDDFGGASVTIPHKQDIIPLLSEISDEAACIGAVNTIIPMGNGVLRGDNTDWIGIQQSLIKLSSINSTRGAGIVFGAGGTARAAIFALQKLGIEKIYVVNRSQKNLASITEAFPAVTSILSIEEASSVADLKVAISTVPANGKLDPKISAIASVVLSRATKSAVLLEMAYKPKVTAMMELAQQHGWQTIEGLEPLIEQGIRQFTLWTGFKLASEFVRDAVLGSSD